MPTLNDVPTEIFISILEHLYLSDPATLLLSQRVSRRFHTIAAEILFPTPARASQPGFCPRPHADTARVDGDTAARNTDNDDDNSSSSSSNRGGGGGDSTWPPPQVHPLLAGPFGGLLTGPATGCLTPAEVAASIWPTLNGDEALPFRRLPWAAAAAGDADRRAAFLRPGASWRALSVTLPGGGGGDSRGGGAGGGGLITRLEVVRSYQTERDDEVSCRVVDLSFSSSSSSSSSSPGGVGRSGGGGGGGDRCCCYLTMGLLYDLLLSPDTHFGRETGDWELFLGRRLRSHLLLQEYECFIPGDADLVADAPGCAILYVQGATMVEWDGEEDEEDGEDEVSSSSGGGGSDDGLEERRVPVWLSDHPGRPAHGSDDAERAAEELEWVPSMIGEIPNTRPWDGP